MYCREFCLVIFAALALSTAAEADTIYLKCGAATHDIDLTNNTVDGRAAIISSTSIDWHVADDIADSHFAIDRTTGVMSYIRTDHRASGDHVVTFDPEQCEKTSAPATKF